LTVVNVKEWFSRTTCPAAGFDYALAISHINLLAAAWPSSTALTVDAFHWAPPCAVGTPFAVKPAAMRRNESPAVLFSMIC
jgi:hypothetical protein